MRRNTLQASTGWGHPMIAEKKTFLSLICLLMSLGTGLAQESFTISNLTSVPQGSYTNPAFVPARLKHYIGVPLLSNIRANGNSQGFKLNNLGVESLCNFTIDNDLARREVSDMNTYRLDSQVDLLYGGIAAKSGFFSFNFSERIVGETWMPRDVFRRYADEDQGDDIDGRWYNLQYLGGEAMHFKEFGIGYSTRNRNGLNWGARLKFLLGHEAITTENEGLVLMETEYGDLTTEGYFAAMTAGFRHFSDEEPLFRLFSAKNAGVALDAGVHYKYNDRWDFSASVRDLGGITWRRGLNYGTLSGNFMSLREEVDTLYNRLVNTPAETTMSFRTTLPTRVMGGARYTFKNQHAINGLATARFYDMETELGVSLGYTLPVTSWLQGTVNYSMYNKTYNNIGAGLAMEFGNVQVYVASDNVASVFGATSATNIHYQAGINLLWKEPEEDEKKRPTVNRDTIQPGSDLVQPSQPLIAGAPSDQEDLGYFTLRSTFSSQESGHDIEAIYVDIYRYNSNKGGEKQLIHTSRYPKDEFEVTLFRVESLHELTVRAYGYEPMVYQFVPDAEGVFREFKLIPKAGSAGK